MKFKLFIPKNLLEETLTYPHQKKLQPRLLSAKIFYIPNEHLEHCQN